MNRLRAGLATLTCVVAVEGCAAAQPSDSPSGPARPPDRASAAAAQTPDPTRSPVTLGRGHHPLDAGTYRLDLTALDPDADSYPAFELTVPEGWESMDGWALLRRPAPGPDVPAVAVTFWDVEEVYAHPCTWNGTLVNPGPGVDDLAVALVEVPMRDPTEPDEVDVDGRSGVYLEWSVPADIGVQEDGDFTDCDATPDGHRDFRSWTGSGWASTRYHQGPGQVDRLWILDVDGERLVIDAFSMPWASAEEVEELVTVVESIRFLEE